MKPPLAVAAVAACLLAACSREPSMPPVPRFVIAPTSDADALPEQLAALDRCVAAHTDDVVVVADDLEAARAARARYATLPIVAVVVEPPVRDQPLPFDAVVVPETGAAQALELALLASGGVEVPPAALPLGARWFTAANVAAGGSALPASGDPILALHRMQHAAVLRPGVDAPQRNVAVGIVGDDAWHARVRRELEAAAKDLPAVTLRVQLGDAIASADLFTGNTKALLLAADDDAAVVALTEKAVAGAVPMFVLPSPFAAEITAPRTIGCDAEIIGRAAAQAVRQLRPRGATIFTLRGSLPPTVAAARRRGLPNGLIAR